MKFRLHLKATFCWGKKMKRYFFQRIKFNFSCRWNLWECHEFAQSRGAAVVDKLDAVFASLNTHVEISLSKRQRYAGPPNDRTGPDVLFPVPRFFCHSRYTYTYTYLGQAKWPPYGRGVCINRGWSGSWRRMKSWWEMDEPDVTTA